MYEHHLRAIDALTALLSPNPEVQAIFLGGSVAKGIARPDSDIDAMVVLTDEAFRRRTEANTITEVIFGHCSYEGGYFDVKYLNRAGLQAVAQRGSEPARNAWVKAKCLFTRDPELAVLAEQAARFPLEEQPQKMLSFYASFHLSFDYLWGTCRGRDAYYRYKTATDVVYFGLRLVLQEARILFPSHRRLQETVLSLGSRGELLCRLSESFLEEMTTEAKTEFVDAVMETLRWRPPEDFSVTLSQYTKDNELWWRDGAPVLHEW